MTVEDRRSEGTFVGRVGGLRLVRASNPGCWNRLARSAPGGTAFHDWEFLDLQERIFGFVVERWLVERDGREVGVLPLARRARLSPRSPWVEFPFLGPAVPVDDVAAVLRAVRQRQRRSGMVLAHFDVAPALASATLASSHRLPMHARHDGTVQIDLSHGSEQQLDARMGKSRRRLIRRAIDDGVTARAARPGEIAAMLGPALDAAYTRRGADNPYPRDIGEVIEEWSADRPEVLLSVAELEGRVVSADVTLGMHSVAVGWVGARAPDATTGHADAVLTRHVLLRAMRAGHTVLDLAGRVDDDVERYKLSFGGEAVTYATVESSLIPDRAVALARRVMRGRA